MDYGRQVTLYLNAEETEVVEYLGQELGLKTHAFLKIALRRFLFGSEEEIPMDGIRVKLDDENIRTMVRDHQAGKRIEEEEKKRPPTKCKAGFLEVHE